MFLFRCKMKFVSYICSTVVFFASVLIYNKDKIKNGYIVMIIKKRIGGIDAPLLGDFALEPSANFNSVFSE